MDIAQQKSVKSRKTEIKNHVHLCEK